MSGEARDRIRQFIAARRGDAERFLVELIRTPSDNPPGDCAPHAAKAAALLEGLGLTVERHPVPEPLVRANGMASATNLVIRERFGAGPTVALNAHGDVVPPGDGWSVDPYGAVVKDGWIYGRGAAASKSDFATYAFALLALKSSGAPLGGTVELHFTYDEEVGGAIGPKWLLAEGISRPDYAIAAGFSYEVVTAHNGCLHLEVEARGKSAHAARPETGHDALEAMTAILAALYSLRESFARRRSAVPGIGHPTLVVGLISGGINTNVVPDRVVARLDRRLIPEENGEAAEKEIVACVQAAVKQPGSIAVATRRVMLAEPLKPVPGQERLAEAIARNAEALFGSPIPRHGVPIYTDARHYSTAGIPTVLYGAGPRVFTDANTHRADERVRLDDLAKATEVVALSLCDLLRPA
ncbi:MAG: M20/M25/M40 family metallo-hydrolase [Alphaproteobacteria bacterium]|nr:M20/M25/M40 family metallo-hydrolase [Alphaproteobacteria bacterium]